MRTRRSLFGLLRIVAGSCAVCLACGSPATVGSQPAKPPRGRPGVKAAGDSSPGGSASRPAAALPVPRKLPTIASIDWDGFPDPARGRHGHSGKIHRVKPGKPGVIAAALSSAGPGDTILLAPGTYREGAANDATGLVLNKPGLVVRTTGGGTARIVPRRGANYGVSVEASDLMIDGLEVQGFKRAGISMGHDSESLRNIIISNTVVRAPDDGQFHDGVVVYQDFRKRGKPVIDGLLMRNVQVIGAGLGISCNAGPCRHWWLEDVTVRNAVGQGWGADAIAVESGDNIVMVRVHVQRSAADGIDMKARHVLVRDSHVHDCNRNGVKLWFGGDVVNTMIHNLPAGEALVFDAAGRYRFLNGLVAFVCHGGGKCYTSISGYDTKARQRVEIVNSIFYATYGGLFFAKNTAVTISNSIFYGMKNGSAVHATVKGRDVTIRASQHPRVFERHGLGRGNLMVDPRFVKPAVKNHFKLHTASPALDRGRVTEAFPDSDRRGRPRIRGRAPDVGPHER